MSERGVHRPVDRGQRRRVSRRRWLAGRALLVAVLGGLLLAAALGTFREAFSRNVLELGAQGPRIRREFAGELLDPWSLSIGLALVPLGLLLLRAAARSALRAAGRRGDPVERWRKAPFRIAAARVARVDAPRRSATMGASMGESGP